MAAANSSDAKAAKAAAGGDAGQHGAGGIAAWRRGSEERRRRGEMEMAIMSAKMMSEIEGKKYRKEIINEENEENEENIVIGMKRKQENACGENEKKILKNGGVLWRRSHQPAIEK